MNDAIRTDNGAFVNDRICENDRSAADSDVGSDLNAGINADVFSDRTIFADRNMRSDIFGFDRRGFGDVGQRALKFVSRTRMKPAGDESERKFRPFDLNMRNVRFGTWADDHARSGGRWNGAGSFEKGDRARFGG